MADSEKAEVPSTTAASEGLTNAQVDGIVKKSAALQAKYTLYPHKILDPDEVLWEASLDSCCVVVAGSLTLRAFYSSIVLWFHSSLVP